MVNSAFGSDQLVKEDDNERLPCVQSAYMSKNSHSIKAPGYCGLALHSIYWVSCLSQGLSLRTNTLNYLIISYTLLVPQVLSQRSTSEIWEEGTMTLWKLGSTVWNFAKSSGFEHILTSSDWMLNWSEVSTVSSLMQSFLSHTFNMTGGPSTMEQRHKLGFFTSVKIMSHKGSKLSVQG